MKGWKSQLFKSCCLRSQEQHTLFSRRGAPRPSPGRTTMVAMVILSLPSYTPSLSSCLCQNACIAGLSPGKGRLYTKWVKCSGSTRTVCWNVGGVEWCAIFSVYANESSFRERRKFCPEIQKHGSYLTRYRQTSLALSWSSGSFPFCALFHKRSVNFWFFVSSRAPLQIIFSQILFSISFWLWHLLCLFKHLADKNRNLCWFSPRAERESLISQGGKIPLKQYIEGKMPATEVCGVYVAWGWKVMKRGE